MTTRVCMNCDNDVPVPEDLVDAAIEVLCPDCLERRRAAELVRRRAGIGLPGELADFTFDSIDDTTGLEAAIALAHRWAAGEVNSALFEGLTGTGKTRVAVAAANEMVRRRPVRFFSMPVLLARLGNGDLNSPLRVQTMRALLDPVALVLDDLDKVRPTAYAAEQVFTAIDARIDGNAPLLITTNLSLRELADYWPAQWGEPIASRLLLADWVRFEGPDRRAA